MFRIYRLNQHNRKLLVLKVVKTLPRSCHMGIKLVGKFEFGLGKKGKLLGTEE